MSRSRKNDQTVPNVPEQERSGGQSPDGPPGGQERQRSSNGGRSYEQAHEQVQAGVKILQVLTYLRFYCPLGSEKTTPHGYYTHSYPEPGRVYVPQATPWHPYTGNTESNRGNHRQNEENFRTILIDTSGAQRNITNLPANGILNHLRTVEAVVNSQSYQEDETESAATSVTRIYADTVEHGTFEEFEESFGDRPEFEEFIKVPTSDVDKKQMSVLEINPFKRWAYVNPAKITAPRNINLFKFKKENCSPSKFDESDSKTLPTQPLPEKVDKYVPFSEITYKNVPSTSALDNNFQDNTTPSSYDCLPKDEQQSSYKPYDNDEYDHLQNADPSNFTYSRSKIENSAIERGTNKVGCLYQRRYDTSDLGSRAQTSIVVEQPRRSVACTFLQFAKIMRGMERKERESREKEAQCSISQLSKNTDQTARHPNDDNRQPDQNNQPDPQYRSHFILRSNASLTTTSKIHAHLDEIPVRRFNDQNSPDANSSVGRNNLPNPEGIYTFDNYMQSNSIYQNRVCDYSYSSAGKQKTINADGSQRDRQNSLILINCQENNKDQPDMNYQPCSNLFGSYTPYSTQDNVSPTLDSGTYEDGKNRQELPTSNSYQSYYQFPDVISATCKEQPAAHYQTNSYNDLANTNSCDYRRPMYQDPNVNYYQSHLNYMNAGGLTYTQISSAQVVCTGVASTEAVPRRYSYYSSERFREYMQERIEQMKAEREQTNPQHRYQYDNVDSSSNQVPKLRIGIVPGNNPAEDNTTTVDTPHTATSQDPFEATGNVQGRIFVRGRARGAGDRGRAIRGQRPGSSNIRLV